MSVLTDTCLYFLKTSKQAREMAQPVTCLSHKHEDLSLILITYAESSAWWHTLVIPAQEAET